MDAYDYYNNLPYTQLAAQQLSSEIKLPLPRGGKESIYIPMRRLVVTGKDTPENMRLIFGQNWEASGKTMYQLVRMEVLVQPGPDSPDCELYSRWDKTAPYWSPRPASDEEKRQMENPKWKEELMMATTGPLGSGNVIDDVFGRFRRVD